MIYLSNIKYLNRGRDKFLDAPNTFTTEQLKPNPSER